MRHARRRHRDRTAMRDMAGMPGDPDETGIREDPRKLAGSPDAHVLVQVAMRAVQRPESSYTASLSDGGKASHSMPRSSGGRARAMSASPLPAPHSGFASPRRWRAGPLGPGL